MKTKYKFIHFEKIDNGLWSCHNNKSCDELGNVEWYPRWKQWVFVPRVFVPRVFVPISETLFSVDCLKDIQDFVGQLAKQKVG